MAAQIALRRQQQMEDAFKDQILIREQREKATAAMAAASAASAAAAAAAETTAQRMMVAGGSSSGDPLQQTTTLKRMPEDSSTSTANAAAPLPPKKRNATATLAPAAKNEPLFDDHDDSNLGDNGFHYSSHDTDNASLTDAEETADVHGGDNRSNSSGKFVLLWLIKLF